jgi:pimeloyl-ACP methyl ester carboxylesterase
MLRGTGPVHGVHLRARPRITIRRGRPRQADRVPRPLVTSTFTDQSGVPARQTIPSWDVVGTADHVITPAEQLFMANRAHAHITEINALHLSMITDPGVVASVIIQAAQATS